MIDLTPQYGLALDNISLTIVVADGRLTGSKRGESGSVRGGTECWSGDRLGMGLAPIAETAFPARNQKMNGVIILQWEDPNNDRECFAWKDKIQAMCKEESRRTGHQPDSLIIRFLLFPLYLLLIPPTIYLNLYLYPLINIHSRGF